MNVYKVSYEQGSNYFGANSVVIDEEYYHNYDCAVACAVKMVKYYFATTKDDIEEQYRPKTEPSNENDQWIWDGECDSGPAYNKLIFVKGHYATYYYTSLGL